MRIYMQIPPGDTGAPKFYHLHLQEDLLEGWTLIREWGFQGAGGRMVRDHYPDRESAEAAMLKHRDAQIRKGYRVVFLQAQS
jgi:predicted DNA-binding WGR domain protein